MSKRRQGGGCISNIIFLVVIWFVITHVFSGNDDKTKIVDINDKTVTTETDIQSQAKEKLNQAINTIVNGLEKSKQVINEKLDETKKKPQQLKIEKPQVEKKEVRPELNPEQPKQEEGPKQL